MLRGAAASGLLRLRCHVGGVRRLSSTSEGGSSNLNPNPGNRDGRFHYSKREAKDLFEEWCKEYSKTYSSEEEKLFRFKMFRRKLEWCHGQNRSADNPEDRIFRPHRFADDTMSEMMQRARVPHSSREERMKHFQPCRCCAARSNKHPESVEGKARPPSPT